MIRLAIIGLALAATTALAQPADPAEAAYQEGRRLYDLHEWNGAIAKFKEAYRLRPEERSLFNIAQAYRLEGDCAQASSFYKTYRRNYPTAPNLAKVDKFIAELESCAHQAPVDAGKPAPPPPPPGTTAPPPSSTVPPAGDSTAPPPNLGPVGQPPPIQTPPIAQTDDTGRTQRLAGLGVIGLGAVAIGTGIVFGIQARSKSTDAQAGHGTWDPSLENDGKHADTIAQSLWAVGGAAVVVGGVLYYFGRHDTPPRVGVAPRTGGAMVVWGCDL